MNNRLKEVREALGLKQPDFAKKLEVTQAAVSAWETGIRKLSNPTITNIKNKFNINPEWLKTGNGEMFLPKADNADLIALLAKEHGMNADQSALIGAFCEMDEIGRDKLVDFVKASSSKMNMANADKKKAPPTQTMETTMETMGNDDEWDKLHDMIESLKESSKKGQSASSSTD